MNENESKCDGKFVPKRTWYRLDLVYGYRSRDIIWKNGIAGMCTTDWVCEKCGAGMSIAGPVALPCTCKDEGQYSHKHGVCDYCGGFKKLREMFGIGKGLVCTCSSECPVHSHRAWKK